MSKPNFISIYTLSIPILILLISISGCISGINPQEIAKQNPLVSQFIKEHPKAQITSLQHFTEQQSQAIIDQVRKDCDNQYLKPAEFYKVMVEDPDTKLQVTVWVDVKEKNIVCMIKKGTPICENGKQKPCGTDTGECTVGVQTCANNQWGSCTNSVQPIPELCDGKDNNCNGLTDENWPNKGKPCDNNQGVYICNDQKTGLVCSTQSAKPATSPGAGAELPLCGDVNNDNQVNQLDVDFIINYLFSNGPAPNLKIANVNGNSVVDVEDVVYLINYIFKHGPKPNCKDIEPSLPPKGAPPAPSPPYAGGGLPSENQPPNITGIDGPTAVQINQSGNWTINAYDPEDGVLSYQATWGDGSSSSIQSSSTFTHAYTTNGTFSINFTVYDNESLSDSETFILTVTSAPQSLPDLIITSVTLNPQKAVYAKTDVVTSIVTFKNIGTGRSEILSYDIRNKNTDWYYYNAQFATLEPNQETTREITLQLTEDLNIFEAMADYRGDVTESNENNNIYTFTIQVENVTNEPPNITGITGPTAIQVDHEGTWTVNAYDPEGGALSYKAAWGDGSNSPIQSTPTFTHTYTQTGIYTATFTVYDEQNLSDSESKTINVTQTPPPNEPPVIENVTGPSQLRVNTQGTWTVTASDPENGSLTYNVSWGDGSTERKVSYKFSALYSPNSQTRTFTHTYTITGLYTIIFTVYDDHNQIATQNFIVNVTQTPPPNNPPSITSVDGPAQLKTNELGTWTVHATDPENKPLSYTANWDDGSGISSRQNSPIFTHTYAKNGTFNINFTVYDDQGLTDSEIKPVTVTSIIIPSVTVVSPNGGEIWDVGKIYTIKWTSVSPDPQSSVVQIVLTDIRFSIEEAIVPSMQNTGSYLWTIPAKLGKLDLTSTKDPVYKVIIRLGNQSQFTTSDTSDAPFSINSTNNPPVIHNIIGPDTLTLNKPGAWKVNASDPEGGPLKYQAYWGDGTFTNGQSSPDFTHTYSQMGSYNIIFTVYDDHNQSATTNKTVKVICLVAKYNFDEGSGIIVHDSSGNGRNGTINQSHYGPPAYGAFWVNEGGRRGLKLVGPFNWIEVPAEDFPDPRNGVILEASIKTAKFPEKSILIYKNNYYYWLGTCLISCSSNCESNHVCFGITTTESDYKFWGETTKLSPNTWYNLKAEFDGKNVKLYVNGVPQKLYRNSMLEQKSTVDGEVLYDYGPFIMASNDVNATFDDVNITYKNCTKPSPKPKSLLGYYHFDENYVDWFLAENQPVYDSSPYKNDGTILVDNSFGAGSVAVTDGIKGKAYYFDGNDIISVKRKNVLVGIDDFTIETWVKPQGIGKTMTITSSPLFRFNSASGGNCLYAEYDINRHLTSSFCNFKNGEWYHLALVKDGEELKIYINGVLDSRKNIGKTYTFNFAQYVSIGSVPSVSDSRYREYGFIGTIDELKIYNYAKTSFDVDKNIAYEEEVCDNKVCQTGLNCTEDFYYYGAYKEIRVGWTNDLWIDQRHMKRCCGQGECLYNTNCYANGAKAHNDAYICNNGKWESVKRTSGNKVLDLRLDEGSGATARDSSGFNNHGTLSPDTLNSWVRGYSGTGIDFSTEYYILNGIYGTRRHIEVPSSSSLINNTNYSIKLDTWVKLNDDFCCNNCNGWCACREWCPKGANDLISKRISQIWGNKEYGYRLYWSETNGSRKFCFNIHTDVYENQYVCSNTGYVPNRWYHVAATYDGDYLRIYVNDILENSVLARGAILNSNDKLIIGALYYRTGRGQNTFEYSYGLNGVMDEIKIYDYITPEENIPKYRKCANNGCVIETCTTGSCQNECNSDLDCIGSGNLAAYYKFDEGKGNKANDSSGHNHHGSIIENPVWVSGIIGKALDFDDSYKNYVSVNSSQDFNTPKFTIKASVRLNSLPESWQFGTVNDDSPIMAKAGQYDFGFGKGCATCTGGVYGSIYRQNIGWDILWGYYDFKLTNWDGSTQSYFSDWYNVSFSFDGTKMKLYVNDYKIAEKTLSGERAYSSSPVTIGGDPISPSLINKFHGAIDEVKFYGYS
jgi:hypothetical protein